MATIVDLNDTWTFATRQIEDGVIQNDFDFGFVGGHLAGDEVEVLPWMTDHLILVVPSNHNLARKKSIKSADLRKERFNPARSWLGHTRNCCSSLSLTWHLLK